jgi:hypothetical protein
MTVRASAVACVFAWTTTAGAVVQPQGPAAPIAAPVDSETVPTCNETFPPNGDRPKMEETFPAKGTTGYALVLEVAIEHKKGETVLPSGLGAKANGDDVKALEHAGFYLPNPGGGSAPSLEVKDVGDHKKSSLKIPVVALPKKPGRAELQLPPLPVAIARASGEVRTLCTKPHRIVVEDAIANTPDAKPKGNTKPRRQVEEWTAAKDAAIGAVSTLVIAPLLAWLYLLWKRRPKPVPPPPPPRPPWEVALEELFDVRIAQLVEQGRYAEHFDRVSDAIRKYLGARYGYDGLETTTHEALHALQRVVPRIVVLGDIDSFLQTADLVKFAKLAPTEAECYSTLARAEDLVRRTMPAMILPGPPPPAQSGAPKGAAAPPPGGPS